MTDKIQTANLSLLIELRNHLDQADHLRQKFNELLSLAGSTTDRHVPDRRHESEDANDPR